MRRLATLLVVLAPSLLVACGSDSSNNDDSSQAAAGAWCTSALPSAAWDGAGFSATTFSVQVLVGDPGSDATGVLCGFTSPEFGYITVARTEAPDAAAAAALVAQPEGSTRTLQGFDTFDAGFVQAPEDGEYRMIAQQGTTVVAGRAAQCSDEETCDEAFAALLASVPGAAAAPSGVCASEDGDELSVLPLVAPEPAEAFALVDGDEVKWVVSSEGIETNLVFAMTGHAADAEDVVRNSAGQIVSVEGTPVLTNSSDLEYVGYVLEKDWAIAFGADHAAVTSYQGSATAPFIEGRFFVSKSAPCVPASSLNNS